MRITSLLLSVIILFSLTIMPPSYAATDGIYTLSPTDTTWDGTDADRNKAIRLEYPYTYTYAYGDEASVTMTLPWSFTFYGQSYSQITADTNGNIWFTSSGSAHSFSLENTSGRGPVISAWNTDLSSYYYGGVFVQHKTSPERVVIEWRTETYSDEGAHRLNRFEAVIFQTGSIRFDYDVLNPSTFQDSGSGIGTGDGTASLSVTSNYGGIFNLAGLSYLFTQESIATPNLYLFFSGSGTGSVISDPERLACTTNCAGEFPAGTSVTLYPTPFEYSLFTGWSNGACSGTGTCGVTVGTAITTATAVFDINSDHYVRTGGETPTYHATIQEAYNATIDASTIMLWAMTYHEDLLCGREIVVTLQGGYDSNYSNVTGDITLDGSLTIIRGTVIADGLSIQ